MLTATLRRRIQPDRSLADQGTFGDFLTSDGFKMVVGELPWRDNRRGVSCITPAPGVMATYLLRWTYSPDHGRNVYLITNTPGRGGVEMHTGNYCGDVSLGYKSDVLGCMIGGDTIGLLTPKNGKPQLAVLNSDKTMAAFEAHMGHRDFSLTVSWG